MKIPFTPFSLKMFALTTRPQILYIGFFFSSELSGNTYPLRKS